MKTALQGFSYASLGSGSKGNATLVAAGNSILLIDCGFSAAELLKRLARRGLSGKDLSAVFLTHEHSDHSTGVTALCRQLSIPLYTSWGSAVAIKDRGAKLDSIDVRHIGCGERIRCADIDVLPVLVPHDAREPLQFVFEHDGQRFGLLTDIGSLSRHVLDHYQDVDALLLECNHDQDMLRYGPYPPGLKARVGSDWGHLNNLQAAEFLHKIDLDRLNRVLIAHISEKNNSTEAVASALHFLPAAGVKVDYANQDNVSDWIAVNSDHNAQAPLRSALA